MLTSTLILSRYYIWFLFALIKDVNAIFFEQTRLLKQVFGSAVFGGWRDQVVGAMFVYFW